MKNNKTTDSDGRNCAVVITRPARAAERAAAALRAEGQADFEILLSPLLAIVPLVRDVDLGAYDAAVFTSENAALSPAFRNMPKEMPAYCIGDSTAAAANAAGFRAFAADASSESLISLAAAHHGGGKLLYLRGRHGANDIAGALATVGLEAEEAIVYDQRAAALNSAVKSALRRDRCIFPVFSARTGLILSGEARSSPDLGHAICCLSANVADAVELDWDCRIAEEPTLSSLLSLTRSLASGAVP